MGMQGWGRWGVSIEVPEYGDLPPGFHLSLESRLLLPEEMRELGTFHSLVRVYLTYEEVYGRSGEWGDAVELLSAYGLTEILDTISRISSALESTALDEEGGEQAKLCGWLWEERVDRVHGAVERRRLELTEKGEPAYSLAVFHELQLANTAKLALLEIAPDNPQTATTPDGLSDALLIVNDLIARQEAPMPLTDDQGSLDNVAFERFLVINSTFHVSDRLMYALARSWELYLRDRAHLEDRGYINLPCELERITGLSPTALWSRWFAVFANRKKKTENELPAPLDVPTYFRENYELPEAEEALFWELIGAPPEALADEYRQRGCGEGVLKPYDNLPLENHPLVLHDGKALCPSALFLTRKITVGLHHIFMNGIETKEARDDYLTYMGEVFGDYCAELLDRIYGDRHVRDSVIRAHIPAGERVCDGLIVYPAQVIAVEFKATLLPLLARVEGHAATLAEVIKRTMISAAEQLDSTITHIRAGSLRDAGVAPEAVRRFLPVVVSLERIPTNPITYDRVVEQLIERDLLQEDDCAAIQFIDVEDLELMEAITANGTNLGDLLAERLASGNHRFGSFKDFIYRTRPEVMDAAVNEFLAVRFKTLSEEALAYFDSFKKRKVSGAERSALCSE